MKTVSEWFSEVKNPTTRKILLARMTTGDRASSSLREAINQGFTWSNTPERHDFWSGIYNNYTLEALDSKLAAIGKAEEKKKEEPKVTPVTVKSVDGYERQISYKAVNGYDVYNHFNVGPFDNCQNMTIGSFENLISNCGGDPVRVKELISYMRGFTGKRLLLVDVHTHMVDSIKKIFSNIKFTTRYDSTNGSDMTVMMINISDCESKELPKS